MRAAARRRRARVEARVLEELRDGCRYVAASLPIRTALIVLAIVSTMAMPYTVLMPAFATDVLHGGPNTLGLLMTASRRRRARRRALPRVAPAVVGLGRVVAVRDAGVRRRAGRVSRSRRRSGSRCIVLPLVGGGFMMQMAATNTVLQTLVDDGCAAG